MILPAAPRPPPGGFHTFLKLWASQGVSQLGSATAWFALTVYLAQVLYPVPAQRPALALSLSLLGISAALPYLMAVPLAGVWADRHDRRATMLTCDVLSAAVSALAALLMALGLMPLWALLVMSATVSVLGSFHGAAFDASYSLMVQTEQLPRANGLMQTAGSLSMLLAPSLAALLTLLPGGVPLALATDALSFLWAAAVLSRLSVPGPVSVAPLVSVAGLVSVADPVQAAPPLKQELAFGWLYILRRPPLVWLLFVFAVINLCLAPLSVFETLLLKGQLSADLKAHATSFQGGLAWLSTLTAAGGVVGGVLISAWGGLKRLRIYGVLLPILAVSLGLTLLGVASTLWLAALALFVVALTGPVMNAHSQAIWQAQVPPELQGRVFSVRRLIAQFISPLSVALAGLLAARFPVGVLLLILAGLLLALLLAQLFNPALRRVEDRDYLEGLARKRRADQAESVQ